MNTKQKYNRIDQSKLDDRQIEILKIISKKTNDFKTKDKDILEKIDLALDDIIRRLEEKNPDALKPISKRTSTKVVASKSTRTKTKRTQKPKATNTTSSTAKSSNNIMSVAKEIQKAGESWKDAMERAKQVLKERREGVVAKKKSELDKLYALVKTKKELQGFTKSDLRRDAVRTAKPRGARVVTKEGSTSNQYGTFPNKLGRKYWETRDRHGDRLAPNYPKDMPLLAGGGGVGSKKYKKGDKITTQFGTYYLDGVDQELQDYIDKHKSMGLDYILAKKNVNIVYSKYFNEENSVTATLRSWFDDKKQPSESQVRNAMIWSYDSYMDYQIKAGGGSKSDSEFSSIMRILIADAGGNDKEVAILKKYSTDFKDVLITIKEIQALEEVLETKGAKDRKSKDKLIATINLMFQYEFSGVGRDINGKPLSKEVLNRIFNNAVKDYSKAEINSAIDKKQNAIMSMAKNSYVGDTKEKVDERVSDANKEVKVLETLRSRFNSEKFADGGSFAPNVSDGTAFMDNAYFAGGGDISIYNLRKGDKVKTRKGDIETIVRRTGSGSYETVENDYSHSPESLEFVSRPSRKMANGGELGYFDDMSEEEILKSTVVFDNNGETYDRYTVFTPDDSVFGMSEDARGFNIYIGDKSEIPMGKHLGKKLNHVPQGIKMAVLNRMKEEYANGGSFAPNVSDGTAFMDNAYFANGGSVGDMVSIELNNGKVITGKLEKLNPIKIRTNESSTQVLPNALIKSIKKITYADGGSFAPSVSDGTAFMDNAYFADGGETDKVSVYGINRVYYLKTKYGTVGQGYKTKSEAQRVADLVNSGRYKLTNWGAEPNYADGGSFAPNVSDGTAFMDNAYFAKGGKVLGKSGDITFTRGRGRGIVKDVYFKDSTIPAHYVSYETDINEVADGLKIWCKIHNFDFDNIERVHFAKGGSVDIIKGAIKVGVFSTEDLKTGVFEKALREKTEETGLTNVDLKVIKKGGKTLIELYLIPNEEAQKKFKIKKWYTKSYPTDDLGEKLDEDATFEDVWTAVNKGANVYSVFGIGDSVIRERIFDKLSKIYGVDYGFIYKKWLKSDDYANGGGIDGGMNNLTIQDVTFGNGGSVKKVPAYVKRRLEELREEIRAERISYGELAELQSLAKYIDPSDVELLQWAGVPEFDEDEDDYAKGGEFALYKIQRKYKYDLQPKWEDEKFQTGGRKFLTFAQAQDFKKKLQGLSSSMEYKVVKVGEDEKLADGGFTPDVSDGTQFMSGVYANGGSVGDVSGNYYSTTDFVSQNDLMDLAKSTFGQDWESGGDYDYDTEEIKMLVKKLGGGYKIVYVDSEQREKFENAKSKYLPLLKNKSNDGDIFVIPNKKMADGGSFAPNVSDGTAFMDNAYFADGGNVKKVPAYVKRRLEELREEIRAERISYSELVELQSLAKYIDPNDVELLEPAGVPEFDEDGEFEVATFSSEEAEAEVIEGGLTYKEALKIATELWDSGEEYGVEIINSDSNALDPIVWIKSKGNYAYGGSVKKVPAKIKKRLEELREEIREERISTGEILELESLKQYIDPSDTELLQWAGVPEFEEDDDNYADGGELKSVVDALFEFNEKRGKLNTSFGAKTKEGVTALIENDNYSSEEIAKAIFYSNNKKEKISTGYGYKSFFGLKDMIERARGKEYADGGSLPYLTDPNFGNFQDPILENGGSLDSVEKKEIRTFVNSLFNKAKNKISNDKGHSLFVLSNTVIATKDSLGNPKFYLGVVKAQNSRPTYVVGSGFLSSDMLVYESYKKDSRFLETESLVDAKKFLTDKVKKQILHLKSKSNYADGGSLPFMTDPNFGNFQNNGMFADGGYFDKLEEVKFVFNVGEKIKIPQIGSKGKLELLDAEIIEQYPAEQNDGTYYPFYYVKGMWENSRKMLYDEEKLLEYGNNPKNSFELGGAFMMTDLAGHTGGGTGGLNADMPLSGTSGTYYTGLVGETGAMSSGELFMDGGSVNKNFDLTGYEQYREFTNFEDAKDYVDNDRKNYPNATESVIIKDKDKYGEVYQVWAMPLHNSKRGNRVYEAGGAMMQNQQVIDGASQNYVITEAFGNPAQQFGMLAKGGSIENQYEGRTPEDIWDNLTIKQKEHFLHDHFDIIQVVAENGGEKISHFGNLNGWAYRTYKALPFYIVNPFITHIKEGQYASGGSLGKALYVEWSSWFVSNKYDEEKIMSVLQSIGAKNIRLENDRGWSNQPEVVVFNGDKNKAQDALNEAFDTDYIRVSEKDWRTKKMADGGSVGDDFEEVIDLGAEQYYTRPFGTVETDSKGEVELVAVATIKDLENYMSEDELPEEGNFQLDITLMPTEEFISEEILESANDEDSSSISDDSVVNVVNYAGGLNYSPEERVLFESHQDALDYLMSKELKDKINSDAMLAVFIMDKKYNRAGQDNWGYLDYLMGVTDRFAKGGATTSNKKGSTDYTYVPNKDVKELSVVVKGELRELMGSDILDGVYVKNSAKSKSGASAETIFAKILKDAKEAKVGKSKRFEASDLKKINLEMAQKLVDAGYTEQQVRNIIFGYAFDNEIVADNELEYDNGIFAYEPTYVQSKINSLVEAKEKNEFVLGIEYPNFDWKSIIKKYKVSTKPKEISYKRELSDGSYYEYYYQVFVGEKIAFGHNLGYKKFDKNGKVEDDYIEKGKVILDLNKLTDWQKEREYTAGFNGGYWYVVSSKIETIDDILKTLLSQKEGYCKELDFYADSFSERLNQNKIAFADGGSFAPNVSDGTAFMDNAYFAKGGKLKKYIDHEDINYVTLIIKGKTTIVSGSDVLNGANLLEDGGDLSKIAFYVPKRDVVSVKLKNGETIKPVNGYWVKKDYEPVVAPTKTPKAGKVTSPNYPNVNFNHKVVINGKTVNLALSKSYVTGLNGSKEYDFIDVDGNPMTGYGFSVKEALKDIEHWQNNPMSNSQTTPAPAKIDESKAHFRMDLSGGKFEVFVDSNFVNQSQGNLPNSELKHLGFGEFYLETPDGNIDFIRTSEEKQGFVGRSHKMKGNDELILKLVNAMKEKGKFEANQTFADGGSLMEVHNGTTFMDNAYFADGGGVDKFSEFDLNKSGNFSSTMNGKNYEIIYRDDKSQMYDLFENGKKIKSSKLVRDLMKSEMFANGGSTGSGFDPVKVKVVLAVGLDRAIEFYDAEYPIRPYQLLEKAVRKGFITLDEINERVVESAMETAQDSEGMEEIGSSDETYAMQEFLDEAGFKTVFVQGRLLRVYAHGGEIRRFDRHEQMDSQTREEILDIVSEPELRGSLTNYLYGLYDGYDYSQTEPFKEEMGKLKSKNSVLYNRINAIYEKIDKYKFEKYDDFAYGGFMSDVYAKGGKLPKKNTPEYRKYQIAKDTIKNPIKGDLMGGMTLEEAKKIVSKYADGGELNKDNVKVGDVLVANTGVEVKVVEFDPKFGGRIRAVRLDEYSTGKASQFMPINKFTRKTNSKMADGGAIGSGKNGYVAFYKGKRIEVYADTIYQAQQIASKHFKARKDYDVNVVLAEVDGKPYVRDTLFADGGLLSSSQIEKLDRGFTIPQLNDMLEQMFPDSFGFEVYKQMPTSMGTRDKLYYDYDNKVKDDKLKLYFHHKDYGRDLNYEVRQGQENTYFNFLLIDDNIDTYVGAFGFKDEGDVDSSYITKFVSFLQDAFHYPLQVRHSVMANGGFMNGVYANGGGSTQGNNIDAELEDFDLDNLDPFETMQYNHFVKSSGKVGALQILINTVEGDYSQLSPELAELAEMQMSTEEYDEATRQMRFERDGYAKGGDVSGKLESGVYRVGKPTKVSANLYEQKIVEIFDNGDISTASDYGRKLGDFKSQKYPIITKERLEAQYKMADGGSTGSGLDPVKVKVVMAVGLDSAIEFYDADYPIRPYQLLERAVRAGYITLDEINERVVDSAMETAQDSEDMEEVGSSDFGAFMYNFLDEAGFKVGRVNGRLTREYADGGSFAPNVADGTAFMDNAYFADGGEIRRFDRQEQMNAQTRGEILDIVGDLDISNTLKNYLYGLYDGYDYSQTEPFKEEMGKLKSKNSVLYNRINAIYEKIDKYKFEKYDDFAYGGFMSDVYAKGGKLPKKNTPEYRKYQIAKDTIKNPIKGDLMGGMTLEEAKKIVSKYADGGMFDDNDGFMKADNNRNFRYPEMEVYVETIDEPIDLTSNVSSRTNNVVVRPLDEEINLNEDGRIRARMSYNPVGRTPEKMMAVNQRMIVTDLPTPTSNTHKND